MSEAENLQIAGLVPFSTVDWPGNLCAVLFLQGCPWRCPYCHNANILDLRTPGTVSWDEVETLLSRRRGLLDGVVFSGGEALVQGSASPGSRLETALKRVRELGFRTGLHTAGAYPRRLEYLLYEGLLDWVGLDIKALPQDYELATGSSVGADRSGETLSVLADYDASRAGGRSDFSWEVRLTLWPGLLSSRALGGEPLSSEQLLDYAREVAQWSREHGARRFAVQRYQVPLEPQRGVDPGLLAVGPHWDEGQAEETLKDLGFLEVSIR